MKKMSPRAKKAGPEQPRTEEEELRSAAEIRQFALTVRASPGFSEEYQVGGLRFGSREELLRDLLGRVELYFLDYPHSAEGGLFRRAAHLVAEIRMATVDQPRTEYGSALLRKMLGAVRAAQKKAGRQQRAPRVAQYAVWQMLVEQLAAFLRTSPDDGSIVDGLIAATHQPDVGALFRIRAPIDKSLWTKLVRRALASVGNERRRRREDPSIIRAKAIASGILRAQGGGDVPRANSKKR
jgi:hypothetical protein